RQRQRPEAAYGSDDDGPHRRLRRQRTADRPQCTGQGGGGHVVHAVRDGADDGAGRGGGTTGKRTRAFRADRLVALEFATDLIIFFLVPKPPRSQAELGNAGPRSSASRR